MVIMNIKEWITSIFPVMREPQLPSGRPKREAVIMLLSIGDLAKSGLDGNITDGMTPDNKLKIQVGSVMLGAYSEILMAEFGISESDLLGDDEILQAVKVVAVERVAVGNVGSPVDNADADT